MPARSVARMIISPLCALTGTPSTSMLTWSSAMCRSCSASGRARSLTVGGETPSAVVDHVFEFVPVVLEEALHRPGRRISERADGVPFDAIRHIEEQAELVAPRLTCEYALQHAVHPAGALPARRALATGLRHVEP